MLEKGAPVCVPSPSLNGHISKCLRGRDSINAFSLKIITCQRRILTLGPRALKGREKGLLISFLPSLFPSPSYALPRSLPPSLFYVHTLLCVWFLLSVLVLIWLLRLLIFKDWFVSRVLLFLCFFPCYFSLAPFADFQREGKGSPSDFSPPLIFPLCSLSLSLPLSFPDVFFLLFLFFSVRSLCFLVN